MPENTPQIKAELPTQEQLISGLEDRLLDMFEKVKSGCTNLADLVFMLQFEGHPMSMAGYTMFTDLFEALPPMRMVFKTGRQVAKTTSGCAADILERTMRPNTKSLIVTPLFSQVHRISTEVAAPMLSRSMFKDEILENGMQQVLKRRYRNGSIDHYSYAFIDAMRIRSITGIDRLWIDEVQDIRAELLPVIEQTQSAKILTGWKWYTGTPLSMGNLLEQLWQESSQAVEAVKCEHCNKWNYACVEMHLLKMIGETTAVCYACGLPLNIDKRIFVPRFPDREEIFAGRHVTQVLHPLHAKIPKQWRELRRNLSSVLGGTGSTGYTTAQAYNEILGESFDSADRMIDLPSLAAACTLGPNTLQEALEQRGKLSIAAVGIDWTGGGDGHSYTKIVLGGMKPGSSSVKILYMTTLPQSLPPQAQIPKVLELVERFRPNILAHDYTGIGWLFESLGLSWNLDKSMIWPFTYGFSPSREVVYTSEATEGTRSSLHLDHTRSLFALFTMIKGGRLQFPDYYLQKNAETGERPVDDFLHMFAEAHQGFRSGELLYVKRDTGHSDDYVHATNFLATACWYASGSYPSIPETGPKGERMTHTPEEAAQMEGRFIVEDDESDPPFVA